MEKLTWVHYLFFFTSYLIGAIPFGVVISKVIGKSDVRDQGSGSTGATNVARLMGKKWGIIVLLLDALKGFVVISIAKHIGGELYCNLTGLLAVVGHCYPVYLKFRGGKGVATALGVLLGLSPFIVMGCLIIFITTAYLTRFMSVASLSAASVLPIFAFLPQINVRPGVAIVMSALIWLKHRENIQRLAKGQEKKFF